MMADGITDRVVALTVKQAEVPGFWPTRRPLPAIGKAPCSTTPAPGWGCKLSLSWYSRRLESAIFRPCRKGGFASGRGRRALNGWLLCAP